MKVHGREVKIVKTKFRLSIWGVHITSAASCIVAAVTFVVLSVVVWVVVTFIIVAVDVWGAVALVVVSRGQFSEKNPSLIKIGCSEGHPKTDPKKRNASSTDTATVTTTCRFIAVSFTVSYNECV